MIQFTADALASAASAVVQQLSDTVQLKPLDVERVLHAAIKLSRVKRYVDRGPALDEQEWRPVLREGFTQYLISGWGFVRWKERKTTCQPDPNHPYPRVGLSAPHRKGAILQTVHELFAVFRNVLEGVGCAKCFAARTCVIAIGGVSL
ncbi:MAG TPA: hypothetical protein VFI31_29325 [Pirellulales bacterium]|nr:hypothetical protein [Pirellulales bacterium]